MELIDQVSINSLSKRDLLLIIKALEFTNENTNLNDFIELYESRLTQECEIYYKKGFRFAYRLIIECFNDEF